MAVQGRIGRCPADLQAALGRASLGDLVGRAARLQEMRPRAARVPPLAGHDPAPGRRGEGTIVQSTACGGSVSGAGRIVSLHGRAEPSPSAVPSPFGGLCHVGKTVEGKR